MKPILLEVVSQMTFAVKRGAASGLQVKASLFVRPLVIARRSVTILFAALALAMVFGTTAQAQLQPFVDCVEPVDSTSYRAYFGYASLYRGNITYSIDSPDNYFTPVPDPPGQPSVFSPGVHHRVVSVVFPISSESEVWVLEEDFAIATPTSMPCNANGTNSRTFTYQGRLSDNAAAANGTYDLQFQLFTGATGTQPRTTLITVEDVSVVGGVFTVQLDLGAATMLAFSEITGNFKLNPAILDAENTFLEIGVRPGTSTAAFTKLNPRQPLTAVPLAMRANTAATAFVAVNADNATNAAKLGNVEANQFVQTGDTRLTDARTPTAGSANYIQNTTTQQTGNLSISGSGTIGGAITAATATANTVNADGATNRLLNARSSSAVGTWLTLNNTTTGGRDWSVISTGASNGEGAGKLLLRDSTNGIVRMTVSEAGASITGNLTVSGAISGATKNFRIDHPLDPSNKVLNYTSIESPDMMNIYNGNVVTDALGEAIITMPDYFQALNKDFRYQLTAIGQFAQAIVAEKMQGNSFKIRTDKPNVEVSWQVTGIRHDKFAQDQRVPTEEGKPESERGKCLYAPACQNQNKERK